MALILTPLAEGGIHREFEAHVLADLQKHDARMHGCPVSRVESKLDGGIAVWFKGHRPISSDPNSGTQEWEGALRFNFPLLRDKKWLGDTNAVVETALQLLVPVRHPSPVIQRAEVQ